ncbi:MAG: PEP-CTERM sorting domain-containing protein [Thiobacillaceae bacterium]|jgi:hypothetical protein|nr:PEP-CTERM sorting domain-containing protein [Thiobacillaceae bacterium]
MKNFKLNKMISGLAATGLLAGVSVTAFAAPTCPETLDPQADYRCVVIDVGTDKNADGNSVTSAFYELGYTGTVATSIYEAGLAIGSKVIDTNISSILQSYGVAAGANIYQTAGNFLNPAFTPATVGLNGTTATTGKDISALNPLGTPDIQPDPSVDTESLNQVGGWRLTYDYYLEGKLGAGGATFDTGYFNLFYDDLATAAIENTQVLRVNVTGSNLNLLNLDVFGLVSFDWDGDNVNDCTTAFCQNFWSFQTGSPSDWYSLVGTGVELNMALDTNVNPPFPTLASLGVTTDGQNGYWVRQTTLDGSVRFSVPEPGTLALLGLGLMGLGFSARRKRV